MEISLHLCLALLQSPRYHIKGPPESQFQRGGMLLPPFSAPHWCLLARPCSGSAVLSRAPAARPSRAGAPAPATSSLSLHSDESVGPPKVEKWGGPAPRPFGKGLLLGHHCLGSCHRGPRTISVSPLNGWPDPAPAPHTWEFGRRSSSSLSSSAGTPDFQGLVARETAPHSQRHGAAHLPSSDCPLSSPRSWSLAAAAPLSGVSLSGEQSYGSSPCHSQGV